MDQLSTPVFTNPHVRWRFTLAKQIAAAYLKNPKVRVVMVAGSVGRGQADPYSDLEIDVYYAAPPTRAERREAVAESGATLIDMDEDEEEWAEGMDFDGFYASTSTFLVATMERYLQQVVQDAQIAPLAQTRLYELQRALPLAGQNQVAQWRSVAERYPEALQQRMAEHYLNFEAFWYKSEMLVARADMLAFYSLLAETQEQLLAGLLGVNRIYLPAPRPLKWLVRIADEMENKPSNLGPRLAALWQINPAEASKQMMVLIDETLQIASETVPAFEQPIQPAKRRAWLQPPPQLATLLKRDG